jgi:hypothetical protein
LADEDLVGRASLTFFKAQKKQTVTTALPVFSPATIISLLCVLSAFFSALSVALYVWSAKTLPSLYASASMLSASFAILLVLLPTFSYVFRRAAAAVYKLDPITDAKSLALWSSHSLRVGACVTLDAMGFTDVQIMWLLRWKSNAFMTYLRNVAVLSG